MSQILSSMQYICFRKISGSHMEGQTCFLPRAPSNLVTPLLLRQQSQESCFLGAEMLLFTLRSTKLRSLPLLAVAVSQHFLLKMSAFNSHMRQNAFDRNWTFEPCCHCYCYAIKSNDRTIRSQALQPASAGEVANMSKLQSHHFMTTEQRTYFLCSVS